MGNVLYVLRFNYVIPCQKIEVVTTASNQTLEHELISVEIQTWILREVMIKHFVTFLDGQIVGCSVHLLVKSDIAEVGRFEIAVFHAPVQEHEQPLCTA